MVTNRRGLFGVVFGGLFAAALPAPAPATHTPVRFGKMTGTCITKEIMCDMHSTSLGKRAALEQAIKFGMVDYALVKDIFEQSVVDAIN